MRKLDKMNKFGRNVMIKPFISINCINRKLRPKNNIDIQLLSFIKIFGRTDFIIPIEIYRNNLTSYMRESVNIYLLFIYDIMKNYSGTHLLKNKVRPSELFN
jgi:hypothetical protein